MLGKTLDKILKAGTIIAMASLPAISQNDSSDPFKGRMTRVYNVPGTTWQWTFDVTNHQLRQVDSETQRSYEDALANLTKFGRKSKANKSLSEIMKKDAVDGKIDNFEVVKNYVDSDIPRHSVDIFALKYKKNHYDLKMTDNPEDPAYLFGQGYGYLKLGNLDEAEQMLTQALANTPDAHNKAIVLNILGVVYDKKGLPNFAAEKYIEAVRNDTSYPTPYFNLAEKLYKKGNKKDALTNYETYLKFNPNDQQTRKNIEQIKKELEIE